MSTPKISQVLKKETKELITQMLKVKEEKERISWREILAYPALVSKKPKIHIIEETIETS
jgi:hypothetical protein